jgi:PRC-barrel domain
LNPSRWFGKQEAPASALSAAGTLSTSQRLLAETQESSIMAQATAHPDRRLISSEDVQGTDVYGVGDEAIGNIDHLLIEKVSGRVAYAVMSFGGFLGLAHSHYPIPWSALKYDTALGGYRTGITEDQLRDAPEFSDDSWTDRDWETRTHQHYNVPPYWGA